MKRFFVETNGDNMVAFTDGTEAFVINENCFDEKLTLDVAKNADYSNLDGCETAEECNTAMGQNGENVYPVNQIFDAAENTVEF